MFHNPCAINETKQNVWTISINVEKWSHLWVCENFRRTESTGLIEVLSLAIKRSCSPMSSPECSNDWKRHVTYIIMNFLSSTKVLTSLRSKRRLISCSCASRKAWSNLAFEYLRAILLKSNKWNFHLCKIALNDKPFDQDVVKFLISTLGYFCEFWRHQVRSVFFF